MHHPPSQHMHNTMYFHPYNATHYPPTAPHDPGCCSAKIVFLDLSIYPNPPNTLVAECFHCGGFASRYTVDNVVSSPFSKTPQRNRKWQRLTTFIAKQKSLQTLINCTVTNIYVSHHCLSFSVTIICTY